MKDRWIIIVLLILSGLISCDKGKSKHYVYGVEPQELYQSASEKKNLKTTSQFIAIAYSDLFNSGISNSQLNKLDLAYQAFGDKHVLEDMIIKNFLSDAAGIIPTNTAMRSDVNAFVQDAYLRFYNRKPDEFEAWKVKDLILNNAEITPQMVYYSLMTSDEYRYY